MAPPVTLFRWHIQEFSAVTSDKNRSLAVFSSNFMPDETNAELCLIYWHHSCVTKGHPAVQILVRRECEQYSIMNFRLWANNTQGTELVAPYEISNQHVGLNKTFGCTVFSSHEVMNLQKHLIKHDDTFVICCEVSPSREKVKETVLINDHAIIDGLAVLFGSTYNYFETDLYTARFCNPQFKRKMIRRKFHKPIKLDFEEANCRIINALAQYIREGYLSVKDLKLDVEVFYYFACKYSAEELKGICFNYMIDTFEDSNVFTRLGFAFHLNDEVLIGAILGYFEQHHQGKSLRDLVYFKEWARLAKDYPELHQQMKKALSSILNVH